MQCVDVCVAAKAQCVPAESRVDDFMRHIEAGWHKWRSKQLKLVQPQQPPRKEQQAQQQPEEQQPQEEEQPQMQQPPQQQQLLLHHSQHQQGTQPQQQTSAQALQLERAGAAGATAAGQPEDKQQQQQQQQQQDNAPKHAVKPPGGLLLLGRYIDAQEWLVVQVLPGLERHAHLAGLLGLLRKWVSRKVEGVSGSVDDERNLELWLGAA